MAKGNFLHVTEKQMDAHIYRIMKEEYVVSLFTERENVLVQPGKWKDKFENFQLSLGVRLTVNNLTMPSKTILLLSAGLLNICLKQCGVSTQTIQRNAF